MKIRGLVLAGGKSRRFGTDKALALYRGKTFLETAVDLLDCLGLKPVIVTRSGTDYDFVRAPILRDKLEDKGPLGGIYTAMRVFRNTDFVVVTCDMPGLYPAAIVELLAGQSPNGRLTVFSLNPRLGPEPFPGFYPASIFPQICSHLCQEQLSVRSLIDAVEPKRVLPWLADPAVLSNVNTPADFSA